MAINSILMLSVHGYVAARPALDKPDTGDQVLYVLELARRFSRLGYHVDLVTRRFANQPEFDQVNENFRVWRIPFGGRAFIRKEEMHNYIGDLVTNVLAAIRKHGRQYDVVYSHYWAAGWAGQKISEELDIPHIHTPHSLGWLDQHNLPGSELSQAEIERTDHFEARIRAEFLIYRNCDHLIATTDTQADLLQTHYDVLERQISIIPPGIDENKFSPLRQADWETLQQQYDLSGHEVLTIGRIAPNKGYDLLIRAFPTLLDLVPEARLMIAFRGENSTGEKEEWAKLQNLAEEIDPGDKIRWLPQIPDRDLANYYRAAGVFALPSRYEPFGMDAVEAMACGTSTVMTVHGGLSELIDFGHQALYADPQRPVEFGAMLALPMLYPNLAHELSVEGSRFARRNFGWTGIAKRILAIFGRVQMVRQRQEILAP
jgi:mannosylfructose-phosphate synthase